MIIVSPWDDRAHVTLVVIISTVGVLCSRKEYSLPTVGKGVDGLHQADHRLLFKRRQDLVCNVARHVLA